MARCTDSDAVFMRSLLETLRRAAIELGVAWGRLRSRGHVMARAQVQDAYGFVRKTAAEIAAIVDDVWGEASTVTALDEALDVRWAQQAVWALRLAGEAVETARTCLRSSARQWVARGHLCDAHGRIKQAHQVLAQLSQRAWE
jgi:hypothetical protein